MKKIVIGIIVLGSSFNGMRAADDIEKQHNKLVALNIVSAFEKVAQSKEFLGWQVNAIKHLQKGLAVIIKQGKPYLSTEEQAAVKKILLALSTCSTLGVDVFSELQLARDPEDATKIRCKYYGKIFNAEIELRKSLEIFEDLQLQDKRLERECAMALFAFMQRFSIAMSVALPMVADELAN